jgi:hypothetical protein
MLASSKSICRLGRFDHGAWVRPTETPTSHSGYFFAIQMKAPQASHVFDMFHA